MVSQRPTVWVLKEQMLSGMNGPRAMDYSAAYEFGDVRFITEFDLPTHPNSSVARNWYDAVHRFLQEYDPANDLIITTGQPLAIFMLGMVMGHLCIIPRILVWKREQNRYVVYQPQSIDSPLDA